jgi:hypothetical protein
MKRIDQRSNITPPEDPLLRSLLNSLALRFKISLPQTR